MFKSVICAAENVCNSTESPCGNNSQCFWVAGYPHSCGCLPGYEKENRTDGRFNCICMRNCFYAYQNDIDNY